MSEGLAPDTFLTITPDENLFTTRAGLGRKIARMVNGVETATITVTLMQNSNANKELMKKYNIAASVSDNSDIAAMTISDKSNTILVQLQDCFIVGLPEFSLAKTYGTVSWTFKARFIVGKDVENDGAGGITGFIREAIGGFI